MRALPSLLTVLLIAACSQPAEPDAGAPDAAPPQAAPLQTGLRLEAMTNAEINGAVPPQLFCAFESEEAVLLAASAPDDQDARAQAVIKTDGRFIAMTRGEAGGYVGMRESGSTFTGGGYEARLSRQDGEGERVGVESTRWPAELIVTRGEDEARLTGAWICGA